MQDLHPRIAANLGAFERVPLEHGGRRRAAVAVVVLPGAAPAVVLTRRASALRTHAGQWALPGGRLDDGEDAVAAALRELHEELGVALPADRVLGLLDDYPTRSGYVITPVVVRGPEPFQPDPDPREVASVHLVPLAELEREEPRFVSIPESDAPVIQLPIMGHVVHAPTAAVLYQFREVALAGRATRVAHLEQPVFAWR